jgi:hypothetical protein
MLSFALSASARTESDAGATKYEGGGYVTAAIELRELAEKGDPIAQTNFGNMYADGIGVPQNYAEAIRWFRKAAAQGHAQAKEMLESLGVGLFPQSIAIEGPSGGEQQAASMQRLAVQEGDDERIEVRITVNSVLLPASHSDFTRHGFHGTVFLHSRHFKPHLRRSSKHKHRRRPLRFPVRGARTTKSIHQMHRLR